MKCFPWIETSCSLPSSIVLGAPRAVAFENTSTGSTALYAGITSFVEKPAPGQIEAPRMCLQIGLRPRLRDFGNQTKPLVYRTVSVLVSYRKATSHFLFWTTLAVT